MDQVISNFGYTDSVKELIRYGFSVLLVFIVSFAVYIVLNKYQKKVIRTNKLDILERHEVRFRIPMYLLIISVSLIAPLSFITTSPKLVDIVQHLLKIVIILSVAWLLIQVVKFIRKLLLKKYNILEKDNLKARIAITQYRVIERILIFIIIVLALSISLMTFEGIRNIGISIIASAGIAGIILGFAAQKAIGTVLAGFQLAISQPIRIDDVVIVENEWGWIEEINLTYVVVKIWDQRRLIVPTTYFIEKPFQNWTRNTAEILGTVFIYTDYTFPVQAMRDELKRLLNETPLWDGRVNVLQVTNSTDKTVELRALMSAVDSPTAWDLRVLIREKLIEFMQKNYPQHLPVSRIEIKNN